MDELTYPFDSSWIIGNKRKLKRRLNDNNKDFLKKKVAILGGFTTGEIKNILEVFLLNEGIQPEFYESEYNHYYEDIMFDDSELMSFSPDIIYICTCNRNISRYPELADTDDEIIAMLNNEYKHFEDIWYKINERYHCPVIQNNFEMPMYRLQGNKDCYDIHGAGYYIYMLNGKLYQFARENSWFYICDLNYISADFGLQKWQNPKYWYMYKYALPTEAIPSLSYNVARIIKSLYGKNKKGLMLDLDNTLWGGVIGDDGIEGIEIGMENGEAEAYYEFQKYIKRLKTLGVLLTINSKNDFQNAIAGLNHPDSILREEDFIEICANWNNKDINHKIIAESIGILPESLVFIDDNPTERFIVKKEVPDTLVPAIDTVEQYIQIIDRLGAFEVTNFSDEDSERNKMYMANKMRRKQEKQYSDYTEFLLSLEMNAEIKNFDPIYYGRIAQLTNKSNQYNLTTRRYTKEEIQVLGESERYITLQGRLIDKFGDNGIVSLIIGEIDGEICKIDLWVMSCRVLKRNMEYGMMDVLAKKCKQRNIKKIVGVYIVTEKNAMVKDHYKKLGFTQETAGEKKSSWALELDNYVSLNNVIKCTML